MQQHNLRQTLKPTAFIAFMLFTVLLTGTLYAAPKVGPVTPENSIIGQNANDRIGIGGVHSLPSGNVVIVSPEWNNGRGAVTCLTPIEYKAGGIVVSAAASLVGSQVGDRVGGGGLTVLINGNYVVSSPTWKNGAVNKAGAVTWVNGATCIPYAGVSHGATVSAANSLVGTQVDDQVGGDDFSGSGVIALTNGNYVVSSPHWDNGSLKNVGAITWGNGITGLSGVVSEDNSLIGGNANDHVGSSYFPNSGLVALTNGNYVVSSPNWNNGMGAATWGDGDGGTFGIVSAANSLIGSHMYDGVSEGEITALTNGNYVVSSPNWNNGAGAATWGNGSTGVMGNVSAANSLVGTNNDQVSSAGITALSNSNYVVSSPIWNDSLGAATWGDGSAGITGSISAENSLVGSTSYDMVSELGVTALTNGNYLVNSPYWDNWKGAATWGNGTGGTVGVVSADNSLVGSAYGDFIGGKFVMDRLLMTIALNNGHYLVISPNWNNEAGAATWGNGNGGTIGVVSAANSLIGSTGDQIGTAGSVALSNGHYVVNTPNWNDGTGAATWGNGNGGTVGIVSPSNSLIGLSDSNDIDAGWVTALKNGNYVVSTYKSTNDEWNIIWGNGSTGTIGVTSPDNSLVMSVLYHLLQITAMDNGNYAVISSSSDSAVTWGNGTGGTVSTISAANSLLGGINDFVDSGGVISLHDGSVLVVSPFWDKSSVEQNIGAVIWSDGTLFAPNSAPILAEIGDQTIDVGATVTFDAEATDVDEPAQTLTYSIVGAPEDASFDTSTGEFSWTAGEEDGGQVFNVTVTVTDDGEPALNDSEDFTISVNPVIVEETNYLPNASFENAGTTNKTAAGWNGVGLTKNDKRICDTETKTYAHDGECAFRFQFNGASHPSRTLQRNLNVANFAKNDVVQLRGMVKANNLTAGARLIVKVVYNNGKIEAVNVKLMPGSYDYAPRTVQITLKRPVKKITVQIKAGSAKGIFFVDDMAVVKLAAPLTIDDGTGNSGLRGLR